jgi:hypothetical protein
LHRAGLGVLAQVDPGVPSNGRNNNVPVILPINGNFVERFLREKSSRRQDYP